ncbi:hypothetical protein [Pseudonocardia adelaidensis]|uniref:Uncharacterized protein n=1 Tax=Pseudonocardia adelaidensis TaxID=648754 RepID=A0ABP9NGE3_9PSEU
MTSEPGPPGTAPARLDLATPRTVSRGLALFGFDWQPTVGDPPDEPGMYAWIIGRGATTSEKLDRPIAYIGIGDRVEGVRGRLRDEMSWVSPSHAHLNGRAMLALEGEPLAGTVTYDPAADLGWVEAALYWSKPNIVSGVRSWITSARPSELRQGRGPGRAHSRSGRRLRSSRELPVNQCVGQPRAVLLGWRRCCTTAQ